MGRKLKYETPQALEDAAEKYFKKCKEEDEFANVAGLAHFLGFQNREALAQLKSRKAEFGYVIDRTKLKMEEMASQKLLTSKQHVSGVIFYLKNNFGWKDEQKQDIHIHGSIQAMTDEQLDQRLKILFKELVKEIGLDGLKQLGFDGKTSDTRNQGDDSPIPAGEG